MKLRTFFSGLLISVLFSGVFVTSAIAHETTAEHEEEHQVEALLEQINELLALISLLQEQLAAIEGGADPTGGFYSDFGVGDDSFQVVSIQRILNQDSRTRVASKGPGSPGQETSYYGALTADAVSRFQELYRSEILTPNGLSAGTGYFGASTRAKMNDIAKQLAQDTETKTENTANNIVPSQPEDTPALPPLDTDSQVQPATEAQADSITDAVSSGNQLNIPGSGIGLQYETYDGFSVGEASSYSGAPGESILLRGTSLTNGSKIFFEDTKVSGVASSDGSTLTFTVPDIEKGPYLLTFESASGEEAIRIMDFTITYENATAPEIFAISPALGPDGTEITIYGTGFTPTGNQIEFGQNIVPNVPSADGKSLKVVVDSGLEIGNTAVNSQNGLAEWPVFIYLANENGRAEEPSVFIIKN